MIEEKTYIRGDVFFAELEGSGSIQSGTRPVVIIQNNIGNKHSSTVIVATVTSQMKKVSQPTHVIVKKDSMNNLKCDSIILLEQIQTINKINLKFKIGRLNEKDVERLNEALSISVALETEKKFKIINRKMMEIRDLEVSLALYCNNIELRDRLLREREVAMKDVQYYCEKYGLDFNDYYIPFKLDNKIVRTAV